MHTDPELITLLALGELAGTEDDRLHAQSCPECADELSQLQRLVTLGRSVGSETTMATPSHDVWARIRAELALDRTLEPPTDQSIFHPVESVARADAEGDLVAHAQLSPVEVVWSHASGRAELATDERGRRVLQVALSADLPPSGVRQAWLLHRDNPKLRQTLGILDGSHGVWTVDHSIDLNEFAILDISQQSVGETEHSGQSIVRGELSSVG